MTANAKFLTPDALLERWGNAVVKQTLSNWRHLGKGPPSQKIGAKVVYPIDGLEKYEAENGIKPANDN